MKHRCAVSVYFQLLIAGLMLIAPVVLASSCSRSAPPTPIQTLAPFEQAMGKLDHRPDWGEHAPLSTPRHPAEKFLHGWVIVLDPGHGGRGGEPNYKRGPTGVREAEMNLRIALLLERLLHDAGAEVILTRRSDIDLPLADRAQIANTAKCPDGGVGADLFLSLHHNLSLSNGKINYTSIWHHAQVDWSESSLDIARYLAHAIGRSLRTDVGYTAPIISDQKMYQGGFGVLRNLQVPGVLLESSFYSNLNEEQRLRDADYNLREAYAIYEGVCEYAYGGRPTQSAPHVVQSAGRIRITTKLEEGLPQSWPGSDRSRILRSTIAVTIDGQAAPFDYNETTQMLTIRPHRFDVSRTHVLSVHHANLFKHHNWPQRYELKRNRDGGAGSWTAQPMGQIRAVAVPDSSP